MEELKLPPRKVIRVWVSEDKYYDVKKPTNGDFLQYQKDAKGAADQEAQAELLFAFLEHLGLPKDVYLALEPDASELVNKALLPQKKTS